MQSGAIVVCKAITGLATVRALGRSGIDVHCLLLEPNDPVRLSRHGRKVPLLGMRDNDPALVDFIAAYARELGSRPVIFPTSDVQTLQLAKYAAALDPVCRIPNNSHGQLLNIIRKDGLYRVARDAGVATIPFIASDNGTEILRWSAANPPPYLVKPFYEGFSGTRLSKKNLVIRSKDELVAYAVQHGMQGVIVQRLLRGGDGFIFDCYGVCARGGNVLTMVSHRRWRQYPPDFGTTTLGEIPAGIGPGEEAALFDDTEKLMGAVGYHGIFGVEWLYERSSGRFYVIDFNARPFTSIGHVEACGINLPFLHYGEMTGRTLRATERRPALKPVLWVDLWRDMRSYREKHQRGGLTFPQWIASIRACRKCAYFCWRDPLPGLGHYWVLAQRLASFALRQVIARGGTR